MNKLIKLVWTCSSPKQHLSSSFGFVLNLVQVEIEQNVVEMEWIEKSSAPTRNSPKLKTRWRTNIFAAYIKNLGRTFLIRAHNLEFRPEKWKKPTWRRLSSSVSCVWFRMFKSCLRRLEKPCSCFTYFSNFLFTSCFVLQCV